MKKSTVNITKIIAIKHRFYDLFFKFNIINEIHILFGMSERANNRHILNQRVMWLFNFGNYCTAKQCQLEITIIIYPC